MESLGYLLKDTSRLLLRRFESYTRPLGVTRAQWQVMFGISRTEGINQAGLADRLDMENITLGRIVDRLEEAGLVERRADPDDRRVWRLYLTDKAQPILTELRTIADRLQAEAVAGISPDELRTLTDLLARVRANVTAPTVAAA